MTKTKEKSMYETSPDHTEIKNHKMIGRTIKSWCTGKEVLAKVTRVWESPYTISMETEHEPVMWGGDYFTEGSVTLRKYDGWIIGTDHLTPEDFLTK